MFKQLSYVITTLILSCHATEYEEVLIYYLNEEEKTAFQQMSPPIPPLCYAARLGRLDAVKDLIENLADIEECDQEGNTPLMEAAKYGHTAVVGFLLDCGAHINTQNKQGFTSLIFASSRGHYEVVSLLLDYEADTEIATQQGQTPLMTASYHGYASIVEILISNNAHINAQDLSGNTPLMYAIQGDHLNIVKYLIRYGAHLEAKNTASYTGLMIASMHGYDAIVEYLIQSGANLENKNKLGQTALIIACIYGHGHTAQILINYGADIYVKDTYSLSILSYCASMDLSDVIFSLFKRFDYARCIQEELFKAICFALTNNNSEIALFLLSKMPDEQKKAVMTYLLFIYAAAAGELDFVKIMMTYMPFYHLVDRQQEWAWILTILRMYDEDLSAFFINYISQETGRSHECTIPLICAAYNGHVDIVKMIMAKGFPIKYAGTALIAAAASGSLQIVTMLVDYGVDIESKDKKGHNALFHASCNGHKQIVKFLYDFYKMAS